MPQFKIKLLIILKSVAMSKVIPTIYGQEMRASFFIAGVGKLPAKGRLFIKRHVICLIWHWFNGRNPI